MRRDVIIYFFVFCIGEAEVQGPGHSINLLRIASTYNRRGDTEVVQCPRDGDHSSRYVMTHPYCLKELRPSEVSGQERFLIVLGALPKIILRKIGHSLFRHSPGEQPGMHRRVVDRTDVMLLTEGQNLRFDIAIDRKRPDLPS